MRTLLEQVAGTPSPSPAVNPQTADVILARAQAGTCAGCHQLSPGDVVREIPNQADVVWPEVVGGRLVPAGGFVHVREDRMLSPALEDSFLPVRRYILGHHLCPPPEAAVRPLPLLRQRLTRPWRSRTCLRPQCRRHALRRRHCRGLRRRAARAPPRARQQLRRTSSPRAAEAIGQLDPVAREALRQKVHGRSPKRAATSRLARRLR